MIAGIAMVKNEEDVIGSVVSHMLSQVDYLIVADNMSTDSTREILESFAGDFMEVIDDNDPAYYQSKKMTSLARYALNKGARWVVPFDADEIWYSQFGLISDILKEVPEQIAVVEAQLFDHVPTGVDDSAISDPIERIRWRRRQPAPLVKVACRTHEALVIEQGNHGARFSGFKVQQIPEGLTIRHFPYRSAAQMWKKAEIGASALSLTDLPEGSGAHWRGYAALGEEAIAGVFSEFFYCEDPFSDSSLIMDPAPVGGS